eukprot:gene19450-biopygen13024
MPAPRPRHCPVTPGGGAFRAKTMTNMQQPAKISRPEVQRKMDEHDSYFIHDLAGARAAGAARRAPPIYAAGADKYL